MGARFLLLHSAFCVLRSWAVRETHLHDRLVTLYETEGPFVSVYMNCEGAIENAAHHNHLRWRAMREAVAREGAEGHALEALDALIPDAHLHGRALAVIATARMPLHVEHLAWPVAHEIAMFRSLPVTAQLIQAEQARVRCRERVPDKRGVNERLQLPGFEPGYRRFESCRPRQFPAP